MFASAIARKYKLIGLTGTAVALGSVALLGASSSSASGIALQPHRHPGIHSSARGCDGRQLGQSVRPGQCVLVRASDFAAGEVVLVRELRQPDWRRTVQADRAGVVDFRFTVGRSGGLDVLTFVGTGAAGPAAAGRGNVSVTVPRIAVWRFLVSSRPLSGRW